MPEATSFSARFMRAIEAGLLLGAKWLIVIVLVGLGVGYVLQDYGIVRQRAYNGQLAYEALTRRAQVRQPQAPPAEAEEPPAEDKR